MKKWNSLKIFIENLWIYSKLKLVYLLIWLFKPYIEILKKKEKDMKFSFQHTFTREKLLESFCGLESNVKLNSVNKTLSVLWLFSLVFQQDSKILWPNIEDHVFYNLFLVCLCLHQYEQVPNIYLHYSLQYTHLLIKIRRTGILWPLIQGWKLAWLIAIYRNFTCYNILHKISGIKDTQAFKIEFNHRTIFP